MDTPTHPIRIAIAFHGGRGHTAGLAEAVAAGAGQVPAAEVSQVPVEQIAAPGWRQLDAVPKRVELLQLANVQIERPLRND